MPKSKQNPQAVTVNTYGFPPGHKQLDYDCAAFTSRLPFERTGLTRVQLYQRISSILTPGYHEWHDWTLRQVGAMCESRWIGLSGCANSSKTHNVVGFAVNWWLVQPEVSSVILCSTTVKALRRRGWANVQQAYQMMPSPKLGNFVDSRMVWQCIKGDDKHAIIGIAVEEGSTTKVADNIKGHKARRMMVIVDEATAVPEAIFDAVSNLYTYPASQRHGDFVLVMIGNPRAKNDQFGRFCEPKNGWTSVTVEDEEWEGKPQMDGRCATILRFDALKSPNILRGTKVSPHLPTKEMVAAAVARAGSENDPGFWSNMRGFWPPEGITSTVFTESLLNASESYRKVVFSGDSFMVGGFDPAFSGGGDRAVLKPARCGMTTGGMAIQLLPHIIIPINATSTNPIAFQLTEGLRANCDKLGIPPENLCIDETGEGGTLCDIVARTWSYKFIRCEFSANASERQISHEDVRLGKDVYKNKATELWFQAREYVNAGQVAGMDKDLAGELCARLYDPEGGSTTRRKLESKVETRSRTGKSPDLADAFVLVCEAARRRGIKIQPIGKTTQRSEPIERESVLAEKLVTENLFEPEDYSLVEHEDCFV